MIVIIPAAGRGLRLRPITNHIPKPLVYVGTKRIIDYILDSYKGLNISKIIFITGYKKEIFEEYVRTNYNYNMEFIEQKSLNGLADALLLGMNTNKNEDVLIQLSDTIVNTNIKDFISLKNNIIAVKIVDNPSRFGIVYERENKIYDMIEKPDTIESKKAIVGLYYFSNIQEIKSAIEYIIKNNIKTKNEYQITDAMKYMIEKDIPMYSYSIDKWIDCGNNEMLIKANRELLKQEDLDNYYTEITKIGSIIGDNVSIFGKCEIINSKISNSIIFPGCKIIDSEINNSIIGYNCEINEFSGQLILGNDCIIEKEEE